jgi:mono/diheme cytochrome c family protein
VELAESTGLTGEEIYAESCAGCHNWEGPLVTTDEAGNEVETPRFTVMVNPSQDPDLFVATFFDKDDELLRSAIAFGVIGQTTSGRAFANMPGFHRQLSRSDIDRVITYIRSMPLVPFVYSYPDGSY